MVYIVTSNKHKLVTTSTMTTTTHNHLPKRSTYNTNRMGVDSLPPADQLLLQTGPDALSADEAYEQAYRTDTLHRTIAGYDNIYESARVSEDWTDDSTGITGGPELLELAREMNDRSYVDRPRDTVVLGYMEAQLPAKEAEYSLDHSAVLVAHPGKTWNQAARAESDNVVAGIDTTINGIEASLRSPGLSKQKRATQTAAKKKAEASKKIYTDFNTAIDNGEYVLGERTDTVKNYVAAAKAAEADPTNNALRGTQIAAQKELEKEKKFKALEAKLYTAIGENTPAYVDHVFTDYKDDRKRKLAPAKDPGPTKAKAEKEEAEDKKENSRVSPEIIRERRELKSIMEELASVQAKTGFSPFKRGALKNRAKQLESKFNTQIKRTSQFEMLEYGLVDPSNPDPDEILQYAEDRTAKAYLELANLTKEKPGSRTMEYFEKHGKTLVLGATALGMVLGGGFGGGITGAAMSMGLRTMSKRYAKNRGKQFDSLMNKAHKDDNNDDYYTNHQLKVSAQKAVKLVRDTRKNFAPKSTDTKAELADKYRKRQQYFNEVFNKAFDGAGSEASKQFNRAVEKEYTRGYLGSIAVGAAVGTTMYVGGHMVGNALSYQFMGGPGSARWMLSTLDYNPAPGTPMSEIPGMVGYKPTYMSIQDAALSNFSPLEQWGPSRGL